MIKVVIVWQQILENSSKQVPPVWDWFPHPSFSFHSKKIKSVEVAFHYFSIFVYFAWEAHAMVCAYF